MSTNFSNAVFVRSVFEISQLSPPDYPEIAFAGRSNVGKSSLINRLVNRKKLVHVSAHPGKTRSLNFYLAGGSVYLVDLPGYGFARVSKQTREKWQGLIEEYLRLRETLCCVVVIIDLRHEPKILDTETVNWLRMNNRPVLLVYTKMDKLSKNEQNAHARILDTHFANPPEKRVLFSAKTGEGLERLIFLLDNALSLVKTPVMNMPTADPIE